MPTCDIWCCIHYNKNECISSTTNSMSNIKRCPCEAGTNELGLSLMCARAHVFKKKVVRTPRRHTISMNSSILAVISSTTYPFSKGSRTKILAPSVFNVFLLISIAFNRVRSQFVHICSHVFLGALGSAWTSGTLKHLLFQVHHNRWLFLTLWKVMAN